jgi:hypothetical protein
MMRKNTERFKPNMDMMVKGNETQGLSNSARNFQGSDLDKSGSMETVNGSLI